MHFLRLSAILLSLIASAQAPSGPLTSGTRLPVLPPKPGQLTPVGGTPSLPPSAPDSQPLLTRRDAEKIAIANNPRLKVSLLLSKVQAQVVRETRADELPNVNGSLTAVEAEQASRISAGSLTSSRLLEHAGMGVQLSQLITDFGHTRNLVASARLREKARQADAEATREDIILATDQVFFQAIQAQAILRVAKKQ